LADALLEQAGINYHKKGNAGLYICLNLGSHLLLTEVNGDEWAAERLLSDRLAQSDVIMFTGEVYRTPIPGNFHLVFCLPENTLREGIKWLQDFHL
ncbi:hypothetical protein BGZ60DRAFT_368409, partial [Tricladium varicosporioides]